MLEESVSNHGHERVAVEAVPGSPLEVIETQFFFQLLVSLLANPSRLDGGRRVRSPQLSAGRKLWPAKAGIPFA
jgi:hypothetical protein